MIPYSTQSIDNSDIEAVHRVLRSGWLTQGPALERFETALAKKAGAKYGVAFNSGTAALHAAYFAAGVGKGDEVIVPALTFAATANAALYLGARPVFADSDSQTGNMSVEDARRRVTKRTKAIVPVDYAGRPADMRAFKALAKKHKLVLIEDAAQALGATYRVKPVGALADMTMFSFHPVKSITTGEGGAIVTNSKAYADALRLFRSHGISKDGAKFIHKDKGAWYQEMQALGYNYRMPELSAALGESQLKRLTNFISRRRAAAKRYDTLLKKIPGLVLPPAERAYEQSAWHLYPLRLAAHLAPKRDEIFAKLRAAGIGVQVHHVPVHTHPYYRSHGYKKVHCPSAEAYVAAEISIPLFPAITLTQQKFVIKTLRQILSAYLV
ncbi:UDP-4-amino-4,6-dideoxy-N-acetyl-beta-L-altrosamine transaminase [Candidatus Kaiserbacteria bacterium CG10_big_fil_rev_8_21_14_0_10_56_12]|uniref:UDP-4-amino-4, 6-dideoxy-N-acetyl-beta-L-altrosamine transaminase n=1 Tax=Candidatus Kaiserbacteria bacterium CG10_big_fil_rev_8_21_14_0_10_56_12 TaxID=1974611 RepID=A0A2H0UAG1_9BACT|nr:MAG: UDP-4-amino-4,6-dideoxy-N-acetyl-beta-L-altrosamine transaminase [Candidatus Kaiserbacteria bacterium CG10_big_fil_rev_8_21_14_0_10_56_12]